jgi:hypothetical protein
MKILLTNVRLAFPEIWEPKAFGDDSKPSCSAVLLIDPVSQAAMLNLAKETVKTVATEKWGPKTADVLKSLAAKGDAICLRNGDTKSEYAGFSGMYYISTRNPARPVVVDRDKTPLTQADGRPYSGCYVDVSIDIWAMDNKWGKRICCKLIALRFVRDGEAFAGGAAGGADDFGDLEDEVGTATGEVGTSDALFG